jgi:hypothetical protein
MSTVSAAEAKRVMLRIAKEFLSWSTLLQLLASACLWVCFSIVVDYDVDVFDFDEVVYVYVASGRWLVAHPFIKPHPYSSSLPLTPKSRQVSFSFSLTLKPSHFPYSGSIFEE